MASDHGRDPADMQFVCRANVVLLDQARPDDGRFPFVGDLDQICADAVAIAAAGADELILEFQLQEGFPRDAEAMLKQALTIRERALNRGVK
jgi:hypothetical protein